MAKIYILEGPNKGDSFELKGNALYVGRSPDNDIHLRDRFISRRHLRISAKGEKFFLEDLGTENGTFIDGEQIRSGKPFEMKEGLPVSIGMSVICIGEGCSEYVLAFLDSIDLSKELSEKIGHSSKDRLGTAKKNMELIYNVCDVLKVSMDLDEILEKVLECIFDLFRRVDRGIILLMDTKTGEFSKVISRFRDHVDDHIMRYSQTVVGRVMRTGKPVMIPNTHSQDGAELAETLELMEIGSVMCVPLVSKSQVRGVIYVDSVDKPYGFRRDDLPLLTAVSSPTAIAIENALLLASLEEMREESSKKP